jgi:hypothetical protein
MHGRRPVRALTTAGVRGRRADEDMRATRADGIGVGAFREKILLPSRETPVN